MLKNLDYSKVLFLDIETVPLAYNFNELDERSKFLWDKKTKYIQEKEEENAEGVYLKAGIYAEFGKVICISVGFIMQKDGEQQIRIKSFSSISELQLLQDFANLLNSHYNNDQYMLCAHNGKEFDIPFLARRFLINGLQLPHLLNVAGKKPWEIKQIDTMELWKFGDFKHYTSLDLLTHIFNIPTPKDDIDGSQVAKVYYEDKDLERIIKYCEKDVVATIQLLRKYRGESLISENYILST
jgi:hypothetical protein